MAKYKKNNAANKQPKAKAQADTSVMPTPAQRVIPANRKTMEQKRAFFAIESVAKIGEQDKEAFKSYVSAFPAMIQTNGLAQALAFIKTKSKENAYKALYSIVYDWLTKVRKLVDTDQDLLLALSSCDMGTYRLAQVETISMLLWLRKIARAEFSKAATPAPAAKEV